MALLEKFIAKNGMEVELCSPEPDDLADILEYTNKLVAENLFLMFGPEPIKLEDEKKWFENKLKSIEAKQELYVLAKLDGKIAGSADIRKGMTKKSHVGEIGLMIAKDFRGQGIGRKLLEYLFSHGPKIGIKIARLDVFSANAAARALYEKVGFRELGVLPNGLYHDAKFYDDIEMYKILEG